VKAFGPVQEYVAPATVGVVRLRVPPAQIGPLFPAVGVRGAALTVATVVPARDVQPATVIVTEYVPVASVVAAGMDGFCKAEVKALGPVQEYVAPATVGVVRLRVPPAQIGPLLAAVGVAGAALTVATVVPARDVQPATVTVTEYVPVAAVVAAGIVGFWREELKALGPVQEYVAPATRGVVRLSVPPAQIGPLLAAVGVAGAALTVATVVPARDVQPATVTVTEYVPEAAVVAAGIVGFCKAEVKALGPVQEYVAPATVGVVRLSVPPAQIGPLLAAVGVAGAALTVAVVVPAREVQPATVTVTE